MIKADWAELTAIQSHSRWRSPVHRSSVRRQPCSGVQSCLVFRYRIELCELFFSIEQCSSMFSLWVLYPLKHLLYRIFAASGHQASWLRGSGLHTFDFWLSRDLRNVESTDPVNCIAWKIRSNTFRSCERVYLSRLARLEFEFTVEFIQFLAAWVLKRSPSS